MNVCTEELGTVYAIGDLLPQVLARFLGAERVNFRAAPAINADNGGGYPGPLTYAIQGTEFLPQMANQRLVGERLAGATRDDLAGSIAPAMSMDFFAKPR